jgi:hypothetical protein
MVIQQQIRLGIMATELPRSLPFANSGFYRKLCLLGEQRGIQVFVFSPNRIRWSDGTVTGYTYNKQTAQWTKGQFLLPSLIYDRCFFVTRETYQQYHKQVRKLRSRTGIRFIGNGLAGKWQVLQQLRTDSYLQPYLPKTEQLSDVELLIDWLAHKENVFLKPQGGSQGKGALHVIHSKDPTETFKVTGRDGRNQPVHKQFTDPVKLKQWLQAFIGRRPYLIQDYLSLHTLDGLAFDVRSLVQKDGCGRWQTTGMAVRCGKPGSITSNLHWGGIAEEVVPFLIREFGEPKTEELQHLLDELSERIPPLLEEAHGRLVELGIDFGIDRKGQIWILEVNSKPGRELFKKLNHTVARRLSLENLIRYAEYLSKRKGLSPNVSNKGSSQERRSKLS